MHRTEHARGGSVGCANSENHLAFARFALPAPQACNYYLTTATNSFYYLASNTENTPPASSCNTTPLGTALTGVNYSVGR